MVVADMVALVDRVVNVSERLSVFERDRPVSRLGDACRVSRIGDARMQARVKLKHDDVR